MTPDALPWVLLVAACVLATGGFLWWMERRG